MITPYKFFLSSILCLGLLFSPQRIILAAPTALIVGSCPNGHDNTQTFHVPKLEGRYKELYDRASAYLYSGDYLLAFFYATLAIGSDAHPADAYRLRGDAVLALTGSHEHALEDFTQAIEVALPEDKPTHFYNRGAAYWNFGDYGQALLDFNQAIELDPQDAMAYFSRGWTFNSLGQYEQAIADFDHAHELDPNCKFDYMGRGSAFYNDSNFNAALIYFNHAKDLDPTNMEAYVWSGFALENLKDYTAALDVLTRAAALDPNHANTYWAQGNIYFDLQRYQESLNAYRQYQQLARDEETPFILARIKEINGILGSN